MPEDHQLLRDYAHDCSESAFTELVRRHVDLVYSAALRETHGNGAMAEDITQAVFAELAAQASRLCRHPALAGWLYTCVRRMSANARRSNDRRQRREQEAHTMNELLSSGSTESSWRQVGPVLDDAMHKLSETDRAAVVLRFFEDHSHKEVGLALGLSESAARKRVDRALESLRELLTKRGVTVGASGLIVLISTNAVHAAPGGLIAAITAATAIAGTTLAATATATATKAIAMTTLQKTLITATLVAGMATPLVIQHQNQVKLRDENALLRQQIEQLSPLTAENERLSNLVARPNAALSSDQLNDLLRLRGEVGMLRRQTNELGKLREENRRLQGAQAKAAQNSQPPNSPQDRAGQVDFPRESWTFAGYANPESAILSLASSAVGGDLETFLNSLTPDFHARQRQNWEPKSDVEIRDQLVKEFGQTKAIRILNKENISENEIILSLLIEQENGHNETPKMKVQRIGDEWKMAGPYRPPAQNAP